MEILSERISVVRSESGTSIVISSLADRKKSHSAGIILLLWLIGGIIMVWSFPSIQEDKTKIVVLIWMAFWLYFLYVLARLWRWKRHGFEVFKINNGQLRYKKDVKGRGWVMDFALEKIQKLRPSDAESPKWMKNFGGDFWNTDCDSIRFDYEDREISIGYNLREDELGKIMKLLGEFVDTEIQESNRRKKEAGWKSKSDSE